MGDYGKRIKLTFDRRVSHLSDAELTKFRFVSTYGDFLYPIAISFGETENIINLDFADFNNIVEPASLECIGCIAMGSLDLPFDPFTVHAPLHDLRPTGEYEYILLSDIAVAGVIQEAFDGKVYASEYVLLSSIDVSADFNSISYSQRYTDTAYVKLNTIAIAGQYCDINGNPL